MLTLIQYLLILVIEIVLLGLQSTPFLNFVVYLPSINHLGFRSSVDIFISLKGVFTY